MRSNTPELPTEPTGQTVPGAPQEPLPAPTPVEAPVTPDPPAQDPPSEVPPERDPPPAEAPVEEPPAPDHAPQPGG